MREVACAVCGALYRFAAAETPLAGTTVPCTRCKARIMVPDAAPAEPLPVAEAMPLAGGTGDVIDLADLPAPRRAAAPPRVGDDADTDLLAPKGPRAAPRPLSGPGVTIDLPAPRGPRAREGEALTLDNIDLLAPVGPVSRAATAPPSMPRLAATIDLPAPVRPAAAPPPVRPAVAPPPVPAGPPPITDLPAPKRPAGPGPARAAMIPERAAPPPERAAPSGPPPLDDLPGLRGSPLDDLPGLRGSPLDDLPGLRGSPLDDLPGLREPAVVDLPAPAFVPAPGFADLPAPKRPALPAVEPARAALVRDVQGLFDDLPAPKGPVLGDLTPKRPSHTDVTPKRPAPGDELTPRAGATNLRDGVETPARRVGSSTDLTPKRASTTDLTPKRGSSTDPGLPVPSSPAVPTGGAADLPAPKGFFDDLPGPALSGSPQLPAPKGFFDDLPGPAMAAAPQVPAPRELFDELPAGRAGTLDLPAPKGFFDDLPQSAPGGGSDVPAPRGFYDDLPQSAGAHARSTSSGLARSDLLEGIELSSPSGSGPLELATPSTSGSPPPALELGDADPLGLELPTAAPSRGVVSWKGGAAAKRGADDAELALAVPSRRETSSSKLPRVRPATPDAKPRMSARAIRIALIIGVLVAAAGAAGFVMYRRWEAKEARAAEIDRTLRGARKALAASDRGHWRKATRAAGDLLQLERNHAEATGIAAQGALAGYLDEGTEAEQRIGAGRRYLDQAATNGLRHAAIDKASALRDLIEGDTAEAIAVLRPIAARGDPDGHLYLGWAQLAGQLWQDAAASFTAAKPARPGPALYGLAQAQAGAGDTAAAHATFLELIALDPEHVGALVGEVVTAPAAEVGRRETSLLAILQRKGIETADPRAVVQAWTRAGDDARRAGRLDAARDRYRKALAILPGDRGALVSIAALELADGKLEAAAEAADKALALAPGDVAANLIAAELELKRSRVADAAQRLSALRQRQPPITTPELLGRLELIDGLRLEAERNVNAALAAYDRAAQTGHDPIAPVIAAATLLGRLADEAERAKQPDAAKAYRDQADERLRTIAAGAEHDANIAITLGVAYLSAGAPAQAERWLRGAIDKRPGAVEAHYQLAEALRRQGKQDEAVATLVKAFELDPTRIDLGVELARGFEAADRDADAAALYKRLLATKNVTADVRARAGRFFARHGDITAARQQGELLLAADEKDATGLFLKAEGLLADGRPIDARRIMQEAVNRDPDPQFLDGLGRASEAHAAQTGDTAMRDEALRAYSQASERDKTMLNPWLGAGRIHLARAEYERALSAYEAALQLAPQHAEIPYGIGIAYAELEDRGQAIAWLSRAVAAQPRADAYWKLGSMYYEIDRAGAAAQALERATQLARQDEVARGTTVPWLTDALWLLGTVQQVLRNDGATKRAWEAYLARNPTNKAQADEVRRNLVPLR